MPKGYVAVELSELDAEQFLLFQKYYNQFREMEAEGVFDVRGGSAIIDFDESGGISRIIRQLYSKKYGKNLS